jgi:O-antigen/teichoic acid export membrane protein
MSGVTPKPTDTTAVADVGQEIGQIARGAGLGLIGNGINTAVTYLFGILIARQIGAEAFGLYTLGVTAVTLASRFTVAGLDRGLMRYASISRGQGQGLALRRLSLWALLLAMATGLAGALWFGLAPATVLRVLRWDDKTPLIPLLRTLAPALPALTLIGVAIAGTQAFRTMRYRVLVVNIIQPLARLGLALLLVVLIGATALAPVVAFTLTQLLGLGLALFFLARLIGQTPSRESALPAGGVRRLVRFSLPLSLSNVLDYLNGRTEILVLGMFLAAGMAGIYNAAGRLATLGLVALTAFNAIFAPVISDLHHRREWERLGTLYKLVTRWTLIVAMPILILQVAFAPALMALFGPDFIVGATALRLLSLGQLVNLATGAVGVMLIMTGRSLLTLFNSVLMVGGALVLDVLLVPRFGLDGAALAGALAIAAINLLRLGQVWWLFRLHPFARSQIKTIMAALPAALVALVWTRWWPLGNEFDLAMACAGVCGVYALALRRLGFDEADRLFVRMLLARRPSWLGQPARDEPSRG